MVPDYLQPDVAIPAQWGISSAAPAAVKTQVSARWWEQFGSAELNRLMQEALMQSPQMGAALAQVAQARAAVAIAGGPLLPSVSASGGASTSHTNPSSGHSYSDTSVNAGLDISYELDLFGANRAGLMSAEAGYQASQADADAVALVLSGDVAATYFNLLNLRERIAIADTNLENAREVLRIMRVRVGLGADSQLELAQQEGVVASREASRTTLAEQEQNITHALAILLGHAPSQPVTQETQLTGLNIPRIDAGIPSDLLTRRPDIQAAESRLIAANADIGAARAAFFPSVNLGGGLSLAAAGFGDPATTIYSLASSLSAPIFRGGALQGGLDQASARQKELAENYRSTVLEALGETEDALAAVNAATARETSLRVAMEQARIAYDLSRRRYDLGAIDFQTLLDTQGTLLSAEDSYTQVRLERLYAAVGLYKALGGGWTSQPAEAAAEEPSSLP
jgi:NodT family efflux transporter outer membrane factor (OMF) lipoprotein